MFEPGSIGGVNRMCPLPNVPPSSPASLLIRSPLAPTAPPLSTSPSLVVRLPWQLCPLDLSTYLCLGHAQTVSNLCFSNFVVLSRLCHCCLWGGKQENYPITEVKSRSRQICSLLWKAHYLTFTKFVGAFDLICLIYSHIKD